MLNWLDIEHLMDLHTLIDTKVFHWWTGSFTSSSKLYVSTIRNFDPNLMIPHFEYLNKADINLKKKVDILNFSFSAV